MLFSPAFILRDTVKASRRNSLVRSLSGGRDLELCLKSDCEDLFSGAFEVAIVLAETYWVSFAHYDTSADGSRKRLLPNGILFGIQFECVSQRAPGTSGSIAYSERDR